MPLSNEPENEPTDKFTWSENQTVFTPDIDPDLWAKLPLESRKHLEQLGYINGVAPKPDQNKK